MYHWYFPKEWKRRAKIWIKKAERTNDEFDKYFSLYVAFNILYNIYYFTSEDGRANKCSSDSRRADNIVKLILDPKQFVIHNENLIKKYIYSIPIFGEEYWRRCRKNKGEGISKLLKNAFENKNYSEVVKQLNRWLYKVRCNLFHGEKSADISKQKKLLGESCKLLMKLTEEIIQNISD